MRLDTVTTAQAVRGSTATMNRGFALAHETNVALGTVNEAIDATTAIAEDVAKRRGDLKERVRRCAT